MTHLMHDSGNTYELRNVTLHDDGGFEAEYLDNGFWNYCTGSANNLGALPETEPLTPSLSYNLEHTLGLELDSDEEGEVFELDIVGFSQDEVEATIWLAEQLGEWKEAA